MHERKKYLITTAAVLITIFALCSILFAGGAGNDADTNSDASDDMSPSFMTNATPILVGTYTGDLGPGDTTDMYKINTAPLEVVACTVSKEADVSLFSVSFWGIAGSTAITSYQMTSYNNVNTVCLSFLTYSGGNYALGMLLAKNETTPCSYTFTVTRSTQNDANTGSDVGIFSDIITVGSYTGYVDEGDTWDRYKILAVMNPFIKIQVNTSSNLEAKFYILEDDGTTTKRVSDIVTVSKGSSGEINHFATDLTSTYYFQVIVKDGSGNYSFKLINEAATFITDGETYSGNLTLTDSEDYYSFYAAENSILEIELNTASGLSVNTYLYDDEGEEISINAVSNGLRNSGSISVSSSESISHFITEAGNYYFKVAAVSGSGSYSFNFSCEIDILCVVPYPNPFNISKNHNKITFGGSGVPYGKIRIYTFDGKLIKSLEETQGNTTIEWYPLQDDVPSGIYYFGAENPDERNMGKITIIR